jgi:hypothetical protein
MMAIVPPQIPQTRFFAKLRNSRRLLHRGNEGGGGEVPNPKFQISTINGQDEQDAGKSEGNLNHDPPSQILTEGNEENKGTSLTYG